MGSPSSGKVTCQYSTSAKPTTRDWVVDFNLKVTVNETCASGTTVALTASNLSAKTANNSAGQDITATTALLPGSLRFSDAVKAITINTATGGTITADKLFAEAGETVTLTAKINSGYALASLTANGTECTKVDNTTYTFTMPNENVTVVPTIEKAYTIAPNGGAPDSKFAVASYANGTKVTSFPAVYMLAGTDLTVSVECKPGYKAVSLSYKDGTETKTVLPNADGNFEFKMPANNVSLTADIEPIDRAYLDIGSLFCEFVY